jgi:3-deoxy-D-manno-octulosonate 8-phosphate phosphatase (KDO 8-P phosphatase)
LGDSGRSFFEAWRFSMNMPKRPASGSSALLRSRLAQVKLVLCDVDGVLTNATVLIGNDTEYKTFNILDGLGMRILQREGIKVGWVSNRPSSATEQRATELKIDFLHQQDGNKVTGADAIVKRAGVSWVDVCFVGDHLVDLGALMRAGVAVVVANAVDEAKALAHYVTKARGGEGAVRELAELILKAQNKWERVVQNYSV